ncbi:heme ABC exporter ATP-binding protein CcmA [Thermanaerothrix sp. 4228-RoL]|uniref:Heme ABC exporter ATP-binding protein CcmA n=1 Tax=Thermanaerothrix solaris TaxID=3058434 RepID=A0ABU3NL70_9CHLR|nr:heme ABC exporter ATP-binding protein CcmA [Thermanaerothrix sp. 4228-RoL]MDT8897577.1 heme ABC exporter ATP-binding protein CcmA [Thermanaerothrix sp. 4228-RoL]
MDIHLKALTFSYPNHTQAVLRGLTLDIPSGQFVAIIGQSGCGKSTLLRLLAGLLSPTHGHIAFNGTLSTGPSQAHTVAWMAQSPALLPWLTTYQNVALALKFTRTGKSPLMSPEEALDRVGLSQYAHEYPHRLSGGMQQRVALARLLVQGAPIWLMDEPFSALDELTRENLSDTLLDLWQWLKPTILWVTHHIYEAVRLADRILVLSPRPAQIAADLEIILPRPRDENHPQFSAYVNQLRKSLFSSNGQESTSNDRFIA